MSRVINSKMHCALHCAILTQNKIITKMKIKSINLGSLICDEKKSKKKSKKLGWFECWKVTYNPLPFGCSEAPASFWKEFFSEHLLLCHEKKDPPEFPPKKWWKNIKTFQEGNAWNCTHCFSPPKLTSITFEDISHLKLLAPIKEPQRNWDTSQWMSLTHGNL